MPEPIPKPAKLAEAARPGAQPLPEAMPERLSASEERGRPRKLLVLSLVAGLVALALLCSGGLMLRPNLLAGGQGTDGLFSSPLDILALGASSASETPEASPTVGGVISGPLTQTPPLIVQATAAPEGTAAAVLSTREETRTPSSTEATSALPTPTRGSVPGAMESPTEGVGGWSTAAAEPTETPEPTGTHTSTSAPTARPTATDVPESTATPEPTSTPEPTETPTAASTWTPSPSPTPNPSPTAAADVYVIQEGDTLLGIAGQYDLALDELLAANPGLDPQRLRIGQEIRLTAAEPEDEPPPAVPSPEAQPRASSQTLLYTIESGDTLLAIAGRYGVTVGEVLEANPGLDPQRMRVGQEIVIPSAVIPGAEAVKSGAVPSRLVVDSIGLDVPVEAVPTRQEARQGAVVSVWEDPASAAGYHLGSGYPGQAGNVVISGRHNTGGEVFRTLAEVQEGARIQLHAGDEVYEYVVERVLVLPQKYVSADKLQANESWLGQTADERLTLISSWPYGNDTHRVVVVASPVVPATAG